MPRYDDLHITVAWIEGDGRIAFIVNRPGQEDRRFSVYEDTAFGRFLVHEVMDSAYVRDRKAAIA